jgi:hypothetical protein
VTGTAWTCSACGRPHALSTLEAGLLRLALRGEAGFELGASGMEDEIRPLLRPCACGGGLVPAPGEPAADADPAHLVESAPLAAGLAALERARDPRLAELHRVWRPRALRRLGRVDELAPEDVLELRLEDRLVALEQEIRRASAAGDEDAAQMAHARYIELGTTYVRRVVAR